MPGEVNFLSDATWGSDDGSDVQSNGDLEEEGKHVLHPTKSAYAMRYPNFDTFAGEPLIDNGYINSNNNQCPAMIVHPNSSFGKDSTFVNYHNTLFTVHNNDMEG